MTLSPHHKAALAKAVQYLRSRGKYIVDKNCTFKPTCAAATNVAETWAKFRTERATTNVRRMK